MPIEIEKKYRLTKKQREQLQRRLPEIGAVFAGEEFEENTLYSGGALDTDTSVLRLRRVADGALLTYKQRFPTSSSIKRHQEDETFVSDAESMAAILMGLGFVPTLVYEKRRGKWHLGDAEIVIDELPFGLFMEIEGPEREIRKIVPFDVLVEIPSLPTLSEQAEARRGAWLAGAAGAVILLVIAVGSAITYLRG